MIEESIFKKSDKTIVHSQKSSSHGKTGCPFDVWYVPQPYTKSTSLISAKEMFNLHMIFRTWSEKLDY